MKKKYITPLTELIILGTGNVMDDLKTSSQEADDSKDPLAKESNISFDTWEDEEDFEAQD